MKGIYGKVEQRLRDHARIKKEIKFRKLELEYPEVSSSNQTMVQTSKTNTDPVARIVEKWETDKLLKDLKRRYDTIEKFLNELEETHRIILEMRYMSREKYSWKVIADRVGYTEGHCRDIRKDSLDRLANMLSWETPT